MLAEIQVMFIGGIGAETSANISREFPY